MSSSLYSLFVTLLFVSVVSCTPSPSSTLTCPPHEALCPADQQCFRLGWGGECHASQQQLAELSRAYLSSPPSNTPCIKCPSLDHCLPPYHVCPRAEMQARCAEAQMYCEAEHKCVNVWDVCALSNATTPSSTSTSVADPSWALCPGAPTDIAVVSIDLTLVQHNISFVLNGKVDEQVTQGAFLVIDVFFNGAKIFTENDDLSNGTTEPFGPGAFTYHKSVDIPSIAPSGAYELNLTFVDQNGNGLTCIQVNFNL